MKLVRPISMTVVLGAVVAWRRRDVLAESPLLALWFLGCSALFVFFLGRLQDAGSRSEGGAGRGGRAALLGLAIAAVAGLYGDVLIGSRTTISAPWFNLVGEELDPAAGFGHLVDPWAGFFIEGPALYLTGAAFRAGEIPYWNPFEACGTPFAANGETAVFSVLQLPLHLAPSLWAWDLFALARIVLAIWFAALAARGLGASHCSAAFAGLAWGLGGVFVLFANLVHLNTALALPLVLLAVEAVIERRSPLRTAALAAALALALNGGNPQPVLALLVLMLPRILLFGSPSFAARIRTWACLAAGLVIAVLINAPALGSMSELLTRSANRTLFALDAPGESPDLLAFAAPPFRMGSATYGIIHQPQFWYLGAAALLLVLAAFLRAVLRGGARDRALAAGLVLFALLLATPLAAVFSLLPLVGGLNWTKYVSAPQLLGLLLAAPLLDRLLRTEVLARRCLAVSAAFLALAATLSLGGPGDTQAAPLVLVVTIPVTLLLLLRAPLAKAWPLLPLLALLEATFHLPDHPARPPEPLDRWPQALSSLREEIAGDGVVPMTERRAAFKDAAPPMLSGLLGWQDFRSVTPLPLIDYHRFVSPWVNCGPWPPYLLLGASREIMLSPVFDHVGVRTFLLREEDFQSVVRSAREELLEDEPVIRFGELQRAMRYGTVESSGLLNLLPYEGACLIAPHRPLRAELDLAAARATIAFRLVSDSGRPFRATGRLANQVFELDETEAAVRIEIAEAREAVLFEIEVDSAAPVRIVFDHWQAYRHISKGRFDFDDVTTSGIAALGLRLLRNRYPLPIARKVRRTIEIESPQEFWTAHRAFVADGSGWKPREETFIEVDADWPAEPREGRVAQPDGESVRLHRRGFNRMILETRLETDTPVFLAVAHDPGWTARAGGDEIPVFRADGAFMALRPGAGERRIELEYRPAGQDGRIAACLVGLLALAATLLSGFVGFRRSRGPAKIASDEGGTK